MIKDNGDIYVCGEGTSGELGLGDNQNKNRITFLMNIPNLKDIICGYNHTLFLTSKILIIFIYFLIYLFIYFLI